MLSGMSLGPGHPVWTQLYLALAHLAEVCGGTFAFVLDEGNGLWCVGLRGRPPTTATAREDAAADRFYRAEIAPRARSMRRASRLEVAREVGNERYVGISFAGIYAVVVWFETDFDVSLVRAMIRRALPEIEALTLALPPSGGPGFDEGAVKLRA
jgi:hypothetical protein